MSQIKTLCYRLRALADYHEAKGTGLPPEEMRALAASFDPPVEHETEVKYWDEPSPNGIAGTWSCSCGSGGTSKNPQGAADLHWMRETGVLPQTD